MQELDSDLSLGQEHMVSRNVLCVVLSVRVSSMCCGSVQHIVVVELVLRKTFRSC